MRKSSGDTSERLRTTSDKDSNFGWKLSVGSRASFAAASSSRQFQPLDLGPQGTSRGNGSSGGSRQFQKNRFEPMELESGNMLKEDEAFRIMAMMSGGEQGGLLGLFPPDPADIAGIQSSAEQGIAAVWQTAEEARLAVRRAGGMPAMEQDGESYQDLLVRAAEAEEKLRVACADMRLRRAELMLCMGREGRALQSPACWEARGGSSMLFGKGKGKGGSGERCAECELPSRKLHFNELEGVSFCAQCCFDIFGEWPTRPAAKARIVLDRYEVHPDDVLGQGGFCTVRRGRDIYTGELVAVKNYTELETLNPQHPHYEEDKAFYTHKIVHEVETFQQLHLEHDVKAQLKELRKSGVGKRASFFVPDSAADGTDKMFEVFGALPQPSELFVRLLGFSEDGDGQPGTSINGGDCCVVLELAEYTLDEYLREHRELLDPLSLTEVREILRQLAEVLAMLHAKKLVHCDLKPLNVMHFAGDRWKLIDMDGMVSAGGQASLCDVFYTPLYCSPEFAELMLGDEELFDVSRLLDVWSLGAMAVELVTLQPLLGQQFEDFSDLGSNEFLKWLSDPIGYYGASDGDPSLAIPMPPEVNGLDPALADLCSQMLERNVNLRASMVEVLLHPFLTEQTVSGGVSGFEKRAAYNLQQGKKVELAPLDGPAWRRASGAAAGGTCVKRRASLLAPDAPEADNNTQRKRSSVSSAFSDVSNGGAPPSRRPPAEENGLAKQLFQEQSLGKGSQKLFPGASATSPPAAWPSMSGSAVPDWETLRKQASAAQKSSQDLCQLLRKREATASGMEAVFWAAAEAEAALWRDTGYPAPRSAASPHCDALEQQVAKAGEALQAAEAELWQTQSCGALPVGNGHMDARGRSVKSNDASSDAMSVAMAPRATE